MNNKKIILSVFYILLGIGLNVAVFVAEIDSFWSGCGAGFFVVGFLQLFKWIKYSKDKEYREKMQIEGKDERNRFLAMKSWSWTGYSMVILFGVGAILFRIFGKIELSTFSGFVVCIMIIFYWISFLILRKKY